MCRVPVCLHACFSCRNSHAFADLGPGGLIRPSSAPALKRASSPAGPASPGGKSGEQEEPLPPFVPPFKHVRSVVTPAVLLNCHPVLLRCIRFVKQVHVNGCGMIPSLLHSIFTLQNGLGTFSEFPPHMPDPVPPKIYRVSRSRGPSLATCFMFRLFRRRKRTIRRPFGSPTRYPRRCPLKASSLTG